MYYKLQWTQKRSMKMARITIEDSLKNCPNVYFLIKLAAKRAHQLQHGAIPKIPVLKDKKGRVDAPTVLALREIAAGFVDFDNEIIPQKDIWGNEIIEQRPQPKKEEPMIAKDNRKEENNNE